MKPLCPPTPLTLLLGAAAACWACGPEPADPVPEDAADRYAEVMCASYQRCGCMGEGLEDMGECLTESKSLFRRMEALPGVRFDAACFERVLDHIAADACGTSFDDVEDIPCQVFVGTLGIGQECPEWKADRGSGGLSSGSCAGGSMCSAGRCIEPPEPEVGLGEACALDLGVRCGQGRYCSSDGVCQTQVGAGEQCDTPRACLGGHLRCAGLSERELGVCSDALTVGSTCDPAEVEQCEYGSLNSFCSSEGVCTGGWPVICRSLTLAPDEYDPHDWIPESSP